MKRKNPILIVLPVLVFTLLIWAVILQSCKKKNNSVLNNVSVSGIFHGDTIWIYDSIPARITFSFDELADGTVNGGAWILFISKRDHFSKSKYRTRHTLGCWEETADGNTLLEGVCDFGRDMGNMAFSGIINKNDVFHYAVASDKFKGEGKAEWAGNYVKLCNKNSLKSTQDTNYLGTYSIAFGLSDSAQDCFNPPSSYVTDPFTLTLVINNQWPDSLGGIDLGGYFDGNIPWLGQGPTSLNNYGWESEVCGGWLNLIALGTSNPGNLAVYCNCCTWNPNATYSCNVNVGYNLDWVDTPQGTVNSCDVIFQGGINLGPRQKK